MTMIRKYLDHHTKEEMSAKEQERRMRRKDAYHLVGSRSRLPTDPDEMEEDMLFKYLLSSPKSNPRNKELLERVQKVKQAKQDFLLKLAGAGGDVTVPSVEDALHHLTNLVDSSDTDTRKNGDESPFSIDGMWIEISKPKFHESLGKNDSNDYLYTLERMSFGMFEPKELVCSIKGSFNPIHSVPGDDVGCHNLGCVPERVLSRMEQLASKHTTKVSLRSYDVVSAFTIEPNLYNPERRSGKVSLVEEPIEGLLTTYGYAFPDPSKLNRFYICFTRGSLELVHEQNRREWKQIFQKNQKHASVQMESDGKLSYNLAKPEGSDEHYVDLLYLDETLRIVRSSTGNFYVFARVPRFNDE